MQAGAEAKKEGIEALGTMVFSVPQAIAASQANLYAISPYFNSESTARPVTLPCGADYPAVRAFADEAYWIDSADPASDHPMAYRMRHMRETYDRLAKETGRSQPQIKGAG
jgi:transaldolase